ncbi:SdrD B-like domain-containing protein [Falsiroseomonas tokyonensis]|uniref:SdrD B-like domain-containing protein n=1 Tax=Falsiroseomonas tokyonensis TaxID=430521 RepID=A0ABV7BX73_9PROT|nr:SdrD B-like domain-containing protein [Falsiroseomonas tokyonensis]MBU8539008.1 hypothetical protein [Falsiroseomonas tokyonensis]
MSVTPRLAPFDLLSLDAPEDRAAADWRLAWLLERPGPPGHGAPATPADPGPGVPPPPAWEQLATEMPGEADWTEAGLARPEDPAAPPAPRQPDAALPPEPVAEAPAPGRATLGGRVFEDANGNGRQDPGEAGVAGRLVALLDATGLATGRSAVTDAEGLFRFEDLAAGTYRLGFAPQGAQPFSTPSPGSQVDPRSGLTEAVTLAEGGAARLDAGVFTPAALAGRAWQDLDGDGSRAVGEAAIAGAGVRLLDAAGRVLAATSTDAEGAWRFSGLAPATYRVEIAWDAHLGRSGMLLLASGELAQDIDLGLVPPPAPSVGLDQGVAADPASGLAALHAMLGSDLVL